MTGNMIGYTEEYYTLQNADGHDLALNGINWFLTEDIAVEEAQKVCVDYKDVVLVRRHVCTITRAFMALVSAEEVSDTSVVASSSQGR